MNVAHVLTLRCILALECDSKIGVSERASSLHYDWHPALKELYAYQPPSHCTAVLLPRGRRLSPTW